ncbi:hypothetical protein P3T25_007246 [Paraburkholderia sp. GAS32]
MIDRNPTLGHHFIELTQARRICDFVPVVASERGAGLLGGDGEKRHVFHSGVVEAGDQMGGAGAGRGDAYTRPAGEFGVGCGHFRMADRNKFDGQRLALIALFCVVFPPRGALASELVLSRRASGVSCFSGEGLRPF